MDIGVFLTATHLVMVLSTGRQKCVYTACTLVAPSRELSKRFEPMLRTVRVKFLCRDEGHN